MTDENPHRLLPIENRKSKIENPLSHLDDLWFQAAGTLCNLTCRHCFISCSPHNRSFGFLTLAEVEDYLEQSVPLGVKEYYFTGGEPFLNPEMPAILERTLNFGPATVLTNGTVLKDEWLDRLRRAEERSLFSLEFRVSIDGCSPETNDPVRGEGTFARAMRGVRQLLEHGFLPIVTVARTSDDQDEGQLFQSFVKVLKAHGYSEPRIKILPTLRLGAEVERQRGYRPEERVTPEMLDDFDRGQLICSHSRMVTDRGVFVCPILIEAPAARMGATLRESLRPFPLEHPACYTCYQYGSICSNVPAAPDP
jgi:sulfatase maturation enzyme AslB (radical SAM superfamily)